MTSLFKNVNILGLIPSMPVSLDAIIQEKITNLFLLACFDI